MTSPHGQKVEKDMKEIYIAEMRFGECYLCAVTVNEKEKTYGVVNGLPYRMILGDTFYVGKIYTKNGGGVFLTEREAREWLEKKLTDYIARLEDDLSSAHNSLKSLKASET
jgi:hypothetical protein